MIEYNLAFYFYVIDDWRNNRAIQLHLNCLKYYAHIFSSALFILAVNNVANHELINDVKKEIIRLGYHNVTFKIIANNPLCEVTPFFNIILPWGNKNNSITFFGHTKGVTNYKQHERDAIDNWILGMYYLSLNYMTEVEDYLLRGWNFLFYGPYLIETETKRNINKYNCNYSGTFFWTNISELYKRVDLNDVSRNHRNAVEFLPGEVGSWDIYQSMRTTLSSHNLIVGYGDSIDLYNNPDSYKFFFEGDDLSNYIEFKNKILENITNENN